MFGYDSLEDYLNDDAARKAEEAEVAAIISAAEREYKTTEKWNTSIELATKRRQERFDLVGPEDY